MAILSVNKMQIDIERVYKVKMVYGEVSDESNEHNVEEVFLTRDMFGDASLLDDSKKDYAINFIFDKNILKEVRVKTKYIDCKQKEIEDLQNNDEKTIRGRITKNYKDKANENNMLLIYIKENKSKKTITKMKDRGGLWKWRFDKFCVSVLAGKMRGQPEDVYRAIRCFLFGVQNPTKAKF